MSNWTHVAGIVRIDSVGGKYDFERIFGKELHYDGPREEWRDAVKNPHKYLPYGSEGSLVKTIWENPKKSSDAKYTVSIFGDLRGYDNPQEIIDWFKKICHDLDFQVRNATITVSNQLYGTINWTFAE